MKYNISQELFETVTKITPNNFEIQQDEDEACITNRVNGYWYHIDINEFFFKCIDFMKDNDIPYFLNIENDIRNEIFEFLDNWLKVNKG